MPENESRRNYKKYIKGQEPLENAVIQHPDENEKTSIYDYVKGKVRRNFWVIPYDRFKKQINKKKD
jgi:hypothetical protein